ncbi:VanW family protein [Ornithinimicrobium sp. F0845]|uniref:VanW family protein n=1 Tax=Ornithinimicrobium sp. F0845 TaxID=2926412 RepID=UPI001FF32D87|nr:VanW family protein [Ornithinimicrobium sp. F0845]
MTERQSLPEEPQRNEWIGILVRTLVAVLVLGGGYYAAAQYLGGRIPNGTQVEGIDIGGLSPEAARDNLQERLEEMATDEVVIEVEGDSFTIDPAEAGLTLDLDGTLEGITGVSYDPSVMWGRITDDGNDLPLLVTVDRAALERAVDELSEDVSIEPVNGSVWFSLGEVRSTESEPGRELDVQATSDAVEAVWPQTTTVTGVLTRPGPDLTQAEIDRFVEQVAAPAVAGPIAVDVDGDESSISPNQLARLLTVVESEDHVLSLELDTDGIREIVSGQLDEATVSPRDASLVLDDGRAVITKARAGQVVDEDELIAGVEAALSKKGDERRVEASTIDVEPTITDAHAADWDISRMATFRSAFPGGAANAARTENIRVGLRHVNGTVVAPGETFSLADTLSPISPERGYVEAGVINNGRLVQGIGGGLSQVSTTVLNTAWDAGLQLDEFHPHSYYISRYPAGKEATIAVGLLDNRWTNDTNTPVLIQTYIEGSEIVMTFWGDRKYQVETISGPRVDVVTPERQTDDSLECLPQSPQEGFRITVTRVLSWSTGEVSRNSWTTTYAPSPEVVCTNPNAG